MTELNIIKGRTDPITTDTEYTLKDGYYRIIPVGVSADLSLSFKASDVLGFGDPETFSGYKDIFLDDDLAFKINFADGDVILYRLHGFRG